MMGLSELVLKVPASEVTSRPPLQGQPQSSLSPMSTSPETETRNRNISNRAPMISGSGSSPISSSLPKAQQPIKSKMKKRESCSKTHSRESSGASNLSVRFTVNDETVRQVQANPSEPGGLVTVRNIGSSQEDITLSDRLSQDDLDEEELLDEDMEDIIDHDDGFHPGSKSCESIPHDRLTPYAEDPGGLRMLPSDAKSQNSDYGSFCHTPSDTFGNQTTTGSGGGNGAGSPDHLDHGQDGHEIDPDHQGDTHSQPLLPSSSQSDRLDEDISSDDDAGANNAGYMRRKTKNHRSSAGASGANTYDAISDTDSTTTASERIKGEPLKTLLAGFFLIFAWVATTTSLALTHERLPEYNTSHNALPDLILDNIKYQSWGLDASEITIMICTWMAFLVTLFHKHRFIVLRRMFLLVGIHYYYRAVTMYVTVLPKPNDNYVCAPKADHVTFMVIFQRVLKLLSGMGLSINGKHVYCGDYIYSGHTMTLIMTYLVIKEYSPKRWFPLHWLSLGLTSFGVVALLLARGHYSIDVVIAYWITTRLWWMYHTMTKHDLLKSRENSDNHLNKIWWWYIFLYFEGRVPSKLPREYGWPLPEKLLQWNVFRRRDLDEGSNLEADPEAGLGSSHRQRLQDGDEE